LADADFRFTPESGLKSDIAPCPFRAKSGSRGVISITSPAATQTFIPSLVCGATILQIFLALRQFVATVFPLHFDHRQQ